MEARKAGVATLQAALREYADNDPEAVDAMRQVSDGCVCVVGGGVWCCCVCVCVARTTGVFFPKHPPFQHNNQPTQATRASVEAANRWLDNLHALKGWARKRFEGHGAELDAFFENEGFSDALDYLPLA